MSDAEHCNIRCTTRNHADSLGRQLRSVMDSDQVKRHDEFSMISIKPKPINKVCLQSWLA